ncbi:MAG: hypothetical protein H8E44_36605 [Planctomycetes bacterium]|nr:hypothetical protein [Planctomycetota bacterium]
MARCCQQFSLRFLLEFLFVIGAGLAGCHAVHSGEANQWAGFNIREGYWGTHFLSSVLYGMGNDAVAMAIVSTLWFVYASLMAIALVMVMRLCFRGGRPLRAR